MKIIFTMLITGLLYCNSFGQYKLQNAFVNLDFNRPTDIVFQDSRVFITEQSGKINVFNNSGSTTVKKTFLTLILPSINTEEGLFSIAFHPNYSVNKYFYVTYTLKTPDSTRLRLSRFTCSANPDSAIRNSEFVIYEMVSRFNRHFGGKLLFDANGYLNISTGDGNTEGVLSQDSSLWGKFLRINVDSFSAGRNYSIPPSNPYYQNQLGIREEIYAAGFRHLWKFSIDPVTNMIWGGDVGESTWEEIDIIKSGKNYGWSTLEGYECWLINCDTAGRNFEPPLTVYNHNVGFSITGGYVYRGNLLPTLYNRYVYADFVSGRVWALNYESKLNRQLLDSTLNIVSFGTDASNELYVLCYNPGRVQKLVSTSYYGYDCDVNGNGAVDVQDLALTDNDCFNYVTGNANSDVNGNNVVDTYDLALVDNTILNQ